MKSIEEDAAAGGGRTLWEREPVEEGERNGEKMVRRRRSKEKFWPVRLAAPG